MLEKLKELLGKRALRMSAEDYIFEHTYQGDQLVKFQTRYNKMIRQWLGIPQQRSVKKK